MKIRLFGTDRFGNYQEEILNLDEISKHRYRNASYDFVVVDEFAKTEDNICPPNTTISKGVAPQPTYQGGDNVSPLSD